MAVGREVTLLHATDELDEVARLAHSRGWVMTWKADTLTLRVSTAAHNGDRYLVQFELADYKELPPIIDFVDVPTDEVGVRRACPRADDSFFQDSGVICAPFSRRAYKSFDARGPHADWNMAAWMMSRDNGTNWANFSRLGDMVSQIDLRLRDPNRYRGRIQQ